MNAVDAGRATCLVTHEPCFAKCLQMLGDGRPADRKTVGNLLDRGWPFAQPLEYGATPQEIAEVLQLAGAIAIHTCTIGIPAVLEAAAAAPSR